MHARVTNVLRRWLIALSLLSLLSVAACGEESVHSDLTIDGQPFGPADCQSGQEQGFYGASLADDRGTVLRLEQLSDGGSSVTVTYPDGGAASYEACGTVRVSVTPDKRGYDVVDGFADLDCGGGGSSSVVGSTRFSGCGHAY